MATPTTDVSYKKPAPLPPFAKDKSVVGIEPELVFNQSKQRTLGECISKTYNTLFNILETGTNDEKIRAAEIIAKLK